MADILCFFRNRCTTVERVDDQTTRSTARVQDTLMEAWVEILVKSPDLEIIGVRGQVRQSGERDWQDIGQDLLQVLGARVGPGIKKIIRGLIANGPLLGTSAALLDECCNGVILSFTRDILALAPRDPAGEKAFFSNMVRANPRLYNSCAALSADSPLLADLDLASKC
jgi:hypothetical protein